MKNTTIIIQAAGRSSRLGSPKQLLRFRGKTLLQHTVDEAINSGAGLVIVVTGAYAAQITGALDAPKAEIIFNPEWEQGKGTGIAAGVKHVISSHPGITQIILAVCDQPYVNAGLFQQLVQTQQDTGKGLVASAYAGTFGTPVLLCRSYFEPLMSLEKDAGAKQLLIAHPFDLATVDFSKGEVDIDTLEDYDNAAKCIFRRWLVRE